MRADRLLSLLLLLQAHGRLSAGRLIERREDGLVVLALPACEAAVSLLTPFGGAVEVLEPAEVRDRLGEIGRALSDLYDGAGNRPSTTG